MKKKNIIIISIIAIILIVAIILGVVFFFSPNSPNKKVVYKVRPKDDTSQGESSDDSTDSDNELQKSDTPQIGVGMLKKVTSGKLGDGYYNVSFEYEHPGVVGLDAHYLLNVTDKMGNTFLSTDYTLKCDNKSVKIDGAELTVPYEVRQSGKPITITVTNKKYPSRTGTYQVTFPEFYEKTTFEDECDFLDLKKWPTNWYDGCVYPVAEDGKYVFRLQDHTQASFEMATAGYFKQSYGCFSARIKVGKSAPGNCAFWMCTDVNAGDMYLYNEEAPRQSGGEIDIIEYFPAWKDRYATTMHWNGWSSFHRTKGKEPSTNGIDLGDDYHIYSAVWTDSAVYFYLDDNLTFVCDEEGSVGKNAGPMHLLLQFSIDSSLKDGDIVSWGDFPFRYDDFPDAMYVDWVRAYQFESLME